MNFLLGIISNLIVLFIGIIFGSKIENILRERKNYFYKLLPFDFTKNKPIIITFGYVSHNLNSKNYSIEQGDLIALLSCFKILTPIGKKNELFFKESINIINDLNLHTNIFTISGPKWNPVTRYFLGEIGAPVKFHKNPKGIYVKTALMARRKFYQIDKEEGKLPKTCYGVIFSSKFKDSYNQDYNVFICAGASTLSTNGCILFLNLLSKSKEMFNDIEKKGISKDEKWGLLLQVNTKQIDSISDVLQEKDVSIKIKKVFNKNDFLQPYTYEEYI